MSENTLSAWAATWRLRLVLLVEEEVVEKVWEVEEVEREQEG